MKAYKKAKYGRSQIVQIKEDKGITIEERIERMLNNNEPVKDIADTIFTERKDGVLPEYNPRTDRWDIAIEATDKITTDNLARRKELMKGGENPDKNGGKNGDEPVQKEPGNPPKKGGGADHIENGGN